MSERLARLAQLFHTARHLRPVQVVGRLRHWLPTPAPDLRPAPSRRRLEGIWQRAGERARSLLGPNRFCLLNCEHLISGVGDWNSREYERLWLYNLHYFDDLNAVAADSRAHWHGPLVDRWIAENPPAAGTGWEPFPTSLRIVNWIKWELARRTIGGTALNAAAVQSLAVQSRQLFRTLEYHLLGNHLLANAKALIFAGAFFVGDEAQRWLAKGLQILRRQLPEQILADGGHFELSPMYHALVLEDLLDLYNLARVVGPQSPELWLACGEALREPIARMQSWLQTMTHPDGQIALFNDAAIGIALSPSELTAYATRLQLPPVSAPDDGLTHLVESGYIRVQSTDAVLLLDVAHVGPDYLPGHAHADSLSYELSLFGQRAIVNSGTSCYGLSAERLRQRSTAAHNTVVIDGQNSSEVWSGFRVARRAYPQNLRIEEPAAGTFDISCEHDGYWRLPGRVLHRRTWRIGPGRLLRVTDQVEGRYSSAEARIHLSPIASAALKNSPIDARPDVSPSTGLSAVTNESAAFDFDGRNVAISTTNARLTEQPASYHPEFGISQPTILLSLEAQGPEFAHEVAWEG